MLKEPLIMNSIEHFRRATLSAFKIIEHVDYRKFKETVELQY